MLDAQHIALADIIRRRSRKAHYMAASSPGRMGIIRGIAAIAGDYASTLPNGQRDAFLQACGHAAATVRGEYDKSPSFINHKARVSDPGQLDEPIAVRPCSIHGCDRQRNSNILFCDTHLVRHYAAMIAPPGNAHSSVSVTIENVVNASVHSAADASGVDGSAFDTIPSSDASLEQFESDTWRDYDEPDGPA